jgi:RHS repeat-associated protein
MSQDDINVSASAPGIDEVDAYYNSIASSTVQGTKADDYVSIVTSYNNGEPDDVDIWTPEEYEQFKNDHPRLNLPELAEGPRTEPRATGPATTGTGNTIGKITHQPKARNVQAGEANPATRPETPEEQGKWSEFKDWVGEAIDGIPDAIEHPDMAALGTGKSLWNTALDMGSLVAQGASYQASGEMMQSAAMMAATGNSAQAVDMMQTAQTLSDSAGNVNFDSAKANLNTPAEHTGDVAVQTLMTVMDGVGVFKGLAALFSKSAVKEAAAVAAKGVRKDAAQAVEPGATVPPRKTEIDSKTAADKDASPSTSDKKNGDNDVDTGTCASDPVDVASGDLLQVLPVIHLPGTLPLTLTRVYRSRSTQSGLFGDKWSDNWSQSLSLDDDEIHFTNHEGSRLSYYASGEDVDALNLQQAHCRLYGNRSGSLYVFNRNTQQTLCFEPQPHARRRLSSLHDAAGNRIVFCYEGELLVRLTHSDGWHIELGYQHNQLIHITRVEGEHRQWLATCSYDNTGRLSECDTVQFTHLWHEYDAQGHMLRWHDTDKTDVRYRYDFKGRVVAVHGEGGYFRDRFVYDELNRRTTYIDGEGGRSVYEYNQAGRVTRAIDPLGRITQTLWDHGNKVRVTDPLGRNTDYHYNAFGQVIQVSNASGDTVRYDYNDAGQVVKLTQPDGKCWQLAWNEQGRPVSRTDPHGQVYFSEYNARGQCLREHQPDGTAWHYDYNARQQLTTLTAPDKAVTRLEQDLFGRVLNVTDPLGHFTRYTHSQEHAGVDGSLTQVNLPDGVQQAASYDGEKRRASITDGEGKTTRYSWGEFDLLLALTRPDGQQLHFNYDTLTRLKQVTCASGEHWHFERDAAGQLIRETDFTGRTVHYTYDAAGRRISAQHPDGRQMRWQYSLRDELLRQDVWQCSNAQSTLLATTQYEYDVQGRMVRAQNDEAVVEFEFDAAGHMVCERLNGQTVTHQWDGQTHRPRARHYNGLDFVYAYDINGRTVTMQAGEFSPLEMEYDAAGRERLRHSAAGFIQAQNYSPTGILLTQAAGRDSEQFRYLLGGEGPDIINSAVNRRFGYDRAYNLLSIDDDMWGQSRFDYDQNDQVFRADAAGMLPLEEHFRYDANLNIRVHNRIPRGVMSGAEQFIQQQEAGRVIRRGACEYRYDDAGRLVEKRLRRDGWRPQTWRYRWNAQSQLSEFITPDGERWCYAYDPFGRRIRKQKSMEGLARTTKPVGCEYQWSGDQMIAETPLYADGRPAYEDSIHWLYAPDALTPVARWQHGQLHYVVSDHMGTPRELLTEQGKVVWAGRLSTWGQSWQWPLAANDADKLSCNLRFAGQYEDEESGLHYNRFRYYDTETGQYLTPDPIGLLGGVNPYGYVHNPLSWIDPLGLCKKSVDTPYGSASQSNSAEALAARAKVENGATLYRMGTTQRSETTGAQFWALEHPSTPGYAGRYGIPQENIDRSNFIMTAKLKPGAEHVTRPAPGIGGNAGGGIEVVVPPDAVDIITFSKY